MQQLRADFQIDEVESLTAARAGAMAGTEPSDGLRVRGSTICFMFHDLWLISQVVNALLTQLDKLKHKKNVLVMSTSNLAKAIGLFSFDLLILSHNQRNNISQTRHL